MPIYLADESRERIDWTIFPSVAVKTNTDRGSLAAGPESSRTRPFTRSRHIESLRVLNDRCLCEVQHGGVGPRIFL
jgi:hypothetical protein